MAEFPFSFSREPRASAAGCVSLRQKRHAVNASSTAACRARAPAPCRAQSKSTWQARNQASSRPARRAFFSMTQKSLDRSIVLSSELVMYMRLPSPVTCIMFGWSPGLMVLCSRGFFRSLTSHCWISSEPKQLTYRKRSSGDWRRSAGSLAVSHSLRAVYVAVGAVPSQSQIASARAQFVKPVVGLRRERPAAFQRRPADRQLLEHLARAKVPDQHFLAEALEIHLGQRLLVVVEGREAARDHAIQIRLHGDVVHVRRVGGQLELADELAVVGELREPRGQATVPGAEEGEQHPARQRVRRVRPGQARPCRRCPQ